jgi:hypothetical protein
MSPATAAPANMPGYYRGRPPRNKGEQYPADPPTVEEIVALMSAVGDRADYAVPLERRNGTTRSTSSWRS